MKKIVLIAALSLATPVALTSMTSCGIMNKASNTIHAVNKISNIMGTANELTGVLGSTLGLDGAQKSSLTGLLGDYMTGTNQINSLLGTNKSSYLTQLGSLNTGLMGKLKGIMTLSQYAKFLNLGGKKKSAKSLLGNLTGGNSLSNDAQSVLTGLLFN